jgi:hypothetical protein
MSFALGLTIALMAIIGITLLAGQICHFGDLEKDPLDSSAVKRPGDAFLRIVGEPDLRRKEY